MIRCFYLVGIVFFSLVSASNQQTLVDLIVFSYNRPLQLYSFLESVDRYIKGLGSVQVVYRSDDAYIAGYDIVRKDFPDFIYKKQGENPREDFKILTEQSAFETPSAYVIFGVDDIIVKDYIDLEQCIALLEETGAYGFYFRLGKNLKECYMLQKKQPLPQLTQVVPGVYSWILGEGKFDWGYPNTLDMTLYRKKDIRQVIRSLKYNSPNTFESAWNRFSPSVYRKKGLCFELSSIINIPMNLVQNDFCSNRHTGDFSTLELLDFFMRGLKIDITKFHQVSNAGAHVAYRPNFILR